MTIDRSNWRWTVKPDGDNFASITVDAAAEDGTQVRETKRLSLAYIRLEETPWQHVHLAVASATANVELAIVQRRMRNQR